MAINSRARRSAALLEESGMLFPDGSLAEAFDRQIMLGAYNVLIVLATTLCVTSIEVIAGFLTAGFASIQGLLTGGVNVTPASEGGIDAIDTVGSGEIDGGPCGT